MTEEGRAQCQNIIRWTRLHCYSPEMIGECDIALAELDKPDEAEEEWEAIEHRLTISEGEVERYKERAEQAEARARDALAAHRSGQSPRKVVPLAMLEEVAAYGASSKWMQLSKNATNRPGLRKELSFYAARYGWEVEL